MSKTGIKYARLVNPALIGVPGDVILEVMFVIKGLEYKSSRILEKEEAYILTGGAPIVSTKMLIQNYKEVP